jgi:2-polyprenyl-3-methyl-5-hydroxy-6-metoxy-1,4-benzoquinol methylase
LKPAKCPITGDSEARIIFSFSEPPAKEVAFPRKAGEPYRREVWQFLPNGHFVSRHDMNISTDYHGSYVDATYENAVKMAETFEKIIRLPKEKSDNQGRFSAVRDFASRWFSCEYRPRLLDVGAGLGVFPYVVKQAGWPCFAIDPDSRAVAHLQQRVGIQALCGDFINLPPSGLFDIVTLNKVLEHVPDPIAMLRRARNWLAPQGFVYVEVPDGEVAFLEGPNREEFTIEHLHVFSLRSLAILASRSGFMVQSLLRIYEPSTKYTLRAFLSLQKDL